MTKSGAVFVAAGILLAATACATDGAQLTPDTGLDSTLPSEPASTSSEADRSTVVTTTTVVETTSEPAGQTTSQTTAHSTTTVTSDVGRFVRAADDGATLTLRVGETAVLIQADPLSADPVVRGDAIELVEIVSVAGTGDRRWEIRAIRPGTSSIEAPDGDETFSITIDVID